MSQDVKTSLGHDDMQMAIFEACVFFLSGNWKSPFLESEGDGKEQHNLK